MESTIKKEVVDDHFQPNPLLALETCKQWITQKVNFPEEEIVFSKRETPTPKFLSVKDWISRFGYIPKGGIRHLIFSNSDFNKRVVKRLGKKILLDVKEFENWISEQNNH